MARHLSRAAGLTATLAALALVVGCQQPGGAGYATMRFAMEQQGATPFLVTAGLPAADAPAVAPGAAFEVHHPAAGPGSATIMVNLGSLAAAAKQRRLLATVADIDHVVITITPASGATASQTIPASSLSGGTGSVTFTGLPPTTATATIQAFDALGLEIGRGTQNVVIDAAVPTLVNFTVTLNPTYVPPTGTINGNVTIVDGPVIVGTPPPSSVTLPGTKLGEVTGIKDPQEVVFDPAGTTAWVPSYSGNKLVAIDRGTVKTKASLTYLSSTNASLLPVDLAFDPSGAMWVANYSAASVSQVNPATGKPLKTVATGINPVDIEFVGGVLHVVSHPLDVIQRFTTAGAPAGLPLPVNPLFGPPKPNTQLPVRLRVSPAGDLWLVNIKSDRVSRLSGTGLPLANITVGDEPEGLAFGAPNVAWVTNNRSNTLMKIDMVANAVVETYKVGGRPRGVAVDLNGNIWVACSEINQVWRLSPAGVVLGKHGTGKDPREITIDPAGAVWVSCGAGGAVQKFAP